MKSYINNLINNETYHFTTIRDSLISEIEKIKKDSKEISGDLIHQINTVRKIDLVREILEEIVDTNYYLDDKSDLIKLNYFLDVRAANEQLRTIDDIT